MVDRPCYPQSKRSKKSVQGQRRDLQQEAKHFGSKVFVMLERAGEGCIYRRARGGDRAPPEDTWTRRPATNGVSERGGRRRSSRGNCGRAETSTGARGWRRTQCAMHCCIGRTAPVLAAVSSGIGERQEGVKRVGTMIVAKFGKVWQSGKRARAQQSARRQLERGDM